MATQSTAIVNLLDLVRNKALPKDAGDEDLFGGMARFDPTAMPVPAQLIAPLPSLPQARPRQPVGNQFDYQPTMRVQRRRNYIALVNKAALPTGLFVIAMVLLSIYLAKGNAPATAVAGGPAPKVVNVTPIAAAKPATTPIVTPIEDPKPMPIVTPIEPEPTVPAAAPSKAAPTVVAEAPAPTVKASKHHRSRDRRAAKRAKVKRVAVVEKAEKPARSGKVSGWGTLSISSSSPRELWIDGRSTKQLTPQRVVLAPGPHNVTLVDRATRKAKTFQVEITAKKTTSVSK